MSARQAARDITAARDALEAFRRVNLQPVSPDGPGVCWPLWATRLALALQAVLGQLDPAAGPGCLDDGQREVMAAMLADALARREPSGQCTGCDDHPAGLCDEHAADLDLTDAYVALGRELGIEVGE